MTTPGPDGWVVRWPTLGFLWADWIEAHCVVPDGFDRGAPFTLLGWQLWCTVNHGRVKPTAKVGRLATAFWYRRSQIIGPQKSGKGPWAAAHVGVEAVGPSLLAGWAGKDDGYACSDWGCGCGWEYPYEPGEPMGRPRPGPLIQLLATSDDQTDNVYRPLQAMARDGALGERMRIGEDFIRLPDDGKVETVSSSASSRLGNPIHFAIQDENGLYTKANRLLKVADTMRRGLAGMGGRSIQTSNAWDPAEESDAQLTMESQAPDVFKFHRLPPANLSYRNKRDRRKIHRIAYEGSDHVDLDAIEAEAAELLEKDPVQAERFFGNRPVAGGGKAYNADDWAALVKPGYLPRRRQVITVGVDGARFDDALAMVATELETGHQWTLGIFEVPVDAPPDYEHNLEEHGEVDGLLAEAFATWDVWRVYIDPQRIERLVNLWQGRWGDRRVIEWFTNRPRQMAYAVRAHVEAVGSGELTHDGDPTLARHIGNAVRKPVNVKDDDDRQMYVVTKDRPFSPHKIDGAIAALLSWEARGDAIAAGVKGRRTVKAHGF